MQARLRLARLHSQFTRFLWRMLTAVLGPFKDAVLEIRVNSGLLFSMLGKVAWLVPLVTFRHVFTTFPTFYRDFAETGPEWAWALVFLGFIACDCAAIIRRLYEWQIVCLVLGALLWLTLCRLVAAGVPHGTDGLPAAPTVYMYLFAGVGCLISAYRLIHQHGARQEAMQFLLVAKRVEAERAQDKPSAGQTKRTEKSGIQETVTAEKTAHASPR